MDDQVADQGYDEEDPKREMASGEDKRDTAGQPHDSAGPPDTGNEPESAGDGGAEAGAPIAAAVEAEPVVGAAVAAEQAQEPAVEAAPPGEPTAEGKAAREPVLEAGPAHEPVLAAEAGGEPAREAEPWQEPGVADGRPPEEGQLETEAAPEPASAPAGEPTMAQLLLEESEYLPGQVAAGDLVEGIVVRKDKDQLVLDIGTKQQAVVPINDLVRLPRDFIDSLRVGQTLPVVVVRPEWREGEVLASAYQARSVADWQRAENLQQSGEIVELRVVGFNKGGVLLEFGQLQGFVPRSHLAGVAGQEEAAREALTQMVGTTVPVRVIEVNRRRRRLIMSHRQAVHQWRANRKRLLMEQLQEGTICHGRVSSVADFGAFVDLGGADGLIHLSELTYERGKHPRDVVRVGQEVDVYVLSVDRERGRIGLSLKRLTEDPWSIAEQEHYVGELVEVTIVSITKFGAFARLEDGLEGLIHVSELADTRIDNPREVVRPGQRITVEIIALDARRKRLGLSIRRVPEHLRQPLSELISQVAHEELPAGEDGAPAFSPESAGENEEPGTGDEEEGQASGADAEPRAEDVKAPDFGPTTAEGEAAGSLPGEIGSDAPDNGEGDGA